MSKSLIHFAHGNGFPATTYRKYLQGLEEKYRIHFIDTIGHQDDYPVTDNWPYLVQEQIDAIQKLQEPVIGLGHSLGGGLLYLAAMQRPDLFKAVLALDSPMYGFLKSFAIWVAKRLNLIGKITAAARTKYRRHSWPDYESMRAYLKGKPLFKNFDPDCLSDYTIYGTKRDAEGIKLKFSRDIESHIFRTLPDNFHQSQQAIKVPFGYIYGERSKLVTHFDRQRLANKFHAIIRRVPGGHLFPFQNPGIAAKTTLELLAEICPQNDGACS
jgi:pimeloyl-ACP methyl ester carboxylesterase